MALAAGYCAAFLTSLSLDNYATIRYSARMDLQLAPDLSILFCGSFDACLQVRHDLAIPASIVEIPQTDEHALIPVVSTDFTEAMQVRALQVREDYKQRVNQGVPRHHIQILSVTPTEINIAFDNRQYSMVPSWTPDLPVTCVYMTRGPQGRVHSYK